MELTHGGSQLGADEQDRSVYEAWTVHYWPGKLVTSRVTSVLGIKMEHSMSLGPKVEMRPRPCAQSELAEMHIRAIENFEAKQRRRWVARAFCGGSHSYEQHLEEECRRLPSAVQAATTQLLLDRGSATSSHCRTRTWTVVAMRAQLRHRFTQVDFPEVTRRRFRFWKNRDGEEPLLYTLVIRGSETRVYGDEDGVTSFARHSNPWAPADCAEMRRRSDEQWLQRQHLRSKQRDESPLRGHRRGRSVSPATRGDRSADESPSANYRYRRSPSPDSSRSSGVRIRARPMIDDHLYHVPAPTPPESFTPPPAVSAYWGLPRSSPPPGSDDGLRRSRTPPPVYDPVSDDPLLPAPYVVGACSWAVCWCRGVPSHAPCLGCLARVPPVPFPSGSSDTAPADPFDGLPSQTYTPPPAPVIPPLSTPTLSSRSFASCPRTPSPVQSASPEQRAESNSGLPRVAEGLHGEQI